MLRWVITGLCLMFFLTAAKAQYTAPTAPVLIPALKGVVTITQPNGQFYTNIGSKDQLFPGSQLVIMRNQVEIARARVRAINRLDSIAELYPEYLGLVLQSGDIVYTSANPVPKELPEGLPSIEPNPGFTKQNVSATILFIVGFVSALSN